MQARRALAGIGLAGLLLASGGVAQAAWPGQFKDVDTWPKWGLFGERVDKDTFSAWGGDLAEAVWWELMVGDPPPSGISTNPRMFRPYDAITRAEFATVLGRALGFEKKGGGAEWFRPIVNQLTQDGIITGGGDFNVPITRREMGEWVGRALEWYGMDLEDKPELNFKDSQGLPESRYIRLATRAGVIKGYPDGTYRPDQTATRAEAAAMGVRLAKLLKKNPPGNEVFDRHYKNQWETITAFEKEVAQGKPYNYSHLLEPYFSEMAIYGYGGYDISARFVSEYYEVSSYRELVSAVIEPVLIRDTIAIVRSTLTLRRVELDGTEVARNTDTFFSYYAKRNGAWIETNSKRPSGYPKGWEPISEGTWR